MEQNLLAHQELSIREQQVLDHITKGLSNKVIAKTLYVTESTVKFHCGSIYKKLQVKNRYGLFSKYASFSPLQY
jgi:DNA-binding NarL/FixJ family response regulator